MRPSHRRPIVLLFVAGVLAACDDGGVNVVAPSDLDPVAGDAQTAVVGTELSQQLTVRVLDERGQPVSGFTVSWAVASGGGSVAPASSATDADGRTSTTWTLGGQAGAQSVTATASGGLGATFTATAQAGPPASLEVVGTTTLDALEATTALTGEVRDAFGNPLETGDVTWASSDESVLTIDADGTATAVANGSADVTASADGLSGSATLTVQQVAASLAITPANPVTTIGGTVQLAASGRDANGFDVAGDLDVAWASGATDIATVDEDGLATGLADGQSVITAAAGGASGTATLTVTAAPFEPTGDVTIDGDLSAASITIPEGVTVTLAGDATLTSAGAMVVAGAITGDCVAAALAAGGDLSVTGSVVTTCSAETDAQPGLSLTSGGGLSVTGATLESSGSVTVSNLGAAAAVGRTRTAAAAVDGTKPGAGAPSWTPPAGGARSAPAGSDCLVSGSLLGSSGRSTTAASGSPRGANGTGGSDVNVLCAGDLILESVRIAPGPGQWGGTGRVTSGGTAEGGDGGRGGRAVIRAANILIRQNSEVDSATDPWVTVRLGAGGVGGSGEAEGGVSVGRGGDGGAAGMPLIEAARTITIAGQGTLRIRGPISAVTGKVTGSGGNGGLGQARSRDGAHATSTSPAEDGQRAESYGGTGADLGGPGASDLIGDLLVGTVEGAAGILIHTEELMPGRGGGAAAGGGKGGAGSSQFKDGGAGGPSTVVGGDAGALLFTDTRSGLVLGEGAAGGSVGVGSSKDLQPSGWGGRGADACGVGAVAPGGRGGRAGIAGGRTGAPSTRNGTPVGAPGEITLINWGLGGRGGDGASPGPGGMQGDYDAVEGVRPPTIVVRPPSDGADGDPCVTLIEPGISVTSDPNGHAPFIGLGSTSQLTVTLGPDGAITISGNGAWITVTGTVAADGSFHTTGTGTAAGFPGVTVTFDGTLGVDAEGRVTGIASGTLTMDAANSVFPPNSGGQRNPAVYSVTGGKIG